MKIFKFIMLILIMFVVQTAHGNDLSEAFLNQIAAKYGEYPKKRLVAWQKLIGDNKQKSDLEKLELVNQFFNLLEYQKDINVWGEEDYWATPLEFLVAGMGDCEDFATAKYFTLLALGVQDEKMLLEYVKIKEYNGVYNQAHMVLLYYATPDAVPLVLDNINKEILPADKRTDLLPIYGFNGTGLWQAKELGKGEKIGERTDLKRWASLEERMKSGTIRKFKDVGH